MDNDEREKYLADAGDEERKEAEREAIHAPSGGDEPILEEMLALEGVCPPEGSPRASTSSPPEPEGRPKKSPVSPKKLAANRANAQRSTGPQTEEGKAKSKFNAVKHGLTARYFANLLQPGTPEWDGYQNHRKELFAYYEPVGPVEEMLIEKTAVETVRYARYLSREQSPAIVQSGHYWDVIKVAVRYQSAINRQLFEAIKELERLQAKRKEEEKGKEAKNAEVESAG